MHMGKTARGLSGLLCAACIIFVFSLVLASPSYSKQVGSESSKISGLLRARIDAIGHEERIPVLITLNGGTESKTVKSRRNASGGAVWQPH